MFCIRQVNQSDFKITAAVETCDTTTAGTGLVVSSNTIVCPVSFFWQPSRWADLFAAHSLPVVLPAPGYYCAEFCALFPAPAGYRVDRCQVVDIDECQMASDSGQVLCEEHATCINQHRSATIASLGYTCVCQHGFFTVQLLPTLCSGQGFDLTFFVTEKKSASATNNSMSSSGTTGLSVMFLLRKARQHVIASIQQRVAGIGDTVSFALLEASSVFTENSISYETTSAGVVWKVGVRIAAAFAKMRALTFRDVAIVVHAAIASNESWPYGGSDAFQLHTQTVCSGGPPNDETEQHDLRLFDVCSRHTECGNAGRGICNVLVAYLQIQTVQTNPKSANVDSTVHGFNLLAVRFDMAVRKWELDLEFEDYQPHTRRVLLLSKTHAVNGIRVFSSANEQLCAVSATATDMALCLHGLSQAFHVLESFDTWERNGSTTVWHDFDVFRDLATGSFADPLVLCTADEREPLASEEYKQTQKGQLRRISLSLRYDDVIDYIGRSTQGTTALDVHFSIGVATLRGQNGIVLGDITLRDILTQIGTNYVLSHDITNAQETDSMTPEVSITMHIVSASVSPKRSWGFVTFHINLPASAASAGITFDHDVIPIDSVTGSIAFFENGAVDTNPYPCIYNPDGDSFKNFAAAFPCGRRLLSVRLLLCLFCDGIWGFASFATVFGVLCISSMISAHLVYFKTYLLQFSDLCKPSNICCFQGFK